MLSQQSCYSLVTAILVRGYHLPSFKAGALLLHAKTSPIQKGCFHEVFCNLNEGGGKSL